MGDVDASRRTLPWLGVAVLVLAIPAGLARVLVALNAHKWGAGLILLSLVLWIVAVSSARALRASRAGLVAVVLACPLLWWLVLVAFLLSRYGLGG
jgi:hypothetical protein